MDSLNFILMNITEKYFEKNKFYINEYQRNN